MARRLIAAVFLFLACALPQVALADAKTGVCTSGTASEAKVGKFMAGVCTECYDQGNCSVNDMLLVVVNASNFMLGLVGALVFLMYIVGGGFMLISAGRPDYITKGKKYIIESTIGLGIILGAYTFVTVLKSVLESGNVPKADVELVICDGTPATEDKRCGVNQRCYKGQCWTRCTLEFKGEKICIDTTSGLGKAAVECAINYCPGGKDVQCCNLDEDALKEIRSTNPDASAETKTQL